jgi:hypothetical protein
VKRTEKKPPKTFVERCYKDKEGNVVLGQTPNLPIILWFLSQIILHFMTNKSTTTYRFFDTIAFGTLFTWAWLELFYGVNYFRRAIGLIVLSVVIFSRIV